MDRLLLVLPAAFLAASAVFSMFGLGGGLFYSPMLVLAGMGVRDASFTSLAVILATSIGALLVFGVSGRVSWRLALLVDPPTDIMAFVGGLYSGVLGREAGLALLLGAMVLAGLLMLRSRDADTPRRAWRGLPPTIAIRHGGETYRVSLIPVGVAAGAVGFVAGAVGITGGVFKVPIMVLLCGVPMDVAAGTSMLMVMLTALFGLLGHLYAGTPHASGLGLQATATLSLAAFMGGLLGARITINTDKLRLRRMFGALLLGLALLIACRELLGPAT